MEINSALLCKEKCRLHCFDRFIFEDRKSINLKAVSRHKANVKKRKHLFFYLLTTTLNKKLLLSLSDNSKKKLNFAKNIKKGTSDKRDRHKNRSYMKIENSMIL